MKTAHNLLGGLAGALALNILHQTAAELYDDAPRVDLIGEEALNKGLEKAGARPLKGETLFTSTLAGDLLSNTLFFSLIGIGKKKYILHRGLAFGLAAGLGALAITEPLGLDDTPITKTNTTKALTVAWYTFGGVIAALAIKSFRNKK